VLQTANRRQTDGPQHIANVNVSSRSLKYNEKQFVRHKSTPRKTPRIVISLKKKKTSNWTASVLITRERLKSKARTDRVNIVKHRDITTIIIILYHTYFAQKYLIQIANTSSN